MSLDRTFNAIALRAMDGNEITSSFVDLGTALASPVYILVIKNTTDAIIYISEDASTIHYELAPGESEMYDFQTNKAGSLGVKRVGLQFSVKGKSGALPTSGRVVIQGQTI